MSEINQTIANLSPEKRALLTLRLKKKRAAAAQEQIIPRREDRDTFPLSFAQQRLWFLDQFEPGNAFYNIPAAIHLCGPLDMAALEQSLNKVISRHQVLRAIFSEESGQPVQLIVPDLSLNLSVVDLQNLPKAEREAQALQLAFEEARRPFDLSRGPLLRAGLLKLDEKEHIALLTMHHIVSDAWSTSVLVREIATLYDAFSRGRPSRQAGCQQSPLPELPIQYADYAHWQRAWLQGEVLDRQLDYWKQKLGTRPSILELPADRSRPPVQTYRGDFYTFALPHSLSEGLKALSRQEDATLFMTLLAVFKTLLYRYTGQDDVTVGTPIANRNRIETEDLIGFFINTLVLRTDLSGDPRFRELLRRVKDVALGAFAHQDLPFEMLVEALQPERDMSHTPLFQVMFVLQNAPVEDLTLPGLTLRTLEVDSGTAKFDLTFFVEDGGNGLRGTFKYSADLFDAATIERMAGHFQMLLEGIIAKPDRRISELPILTDAERRQLLVEWNDTAADYPQNQCIHQAFEAQVERTPDAAAVIFEQEQLAYRELNRRANQLAHHLQKLGVGPETLVGLCVGRSVEMVVGLMGILKAGGVYLPLDPDYPSDRLAFMLHNAQVPVLLTQEQLVDRLPISQADQLSSHPRSLAPPTRADEDFKPPLALSASAREGQQARREITNPSTIIRLDADWDEIARECDENPISDVIPENLAYVIYTSGSVGRPKGVMIQHRSVLNLVTALHRAIYAFHPSDQLRVSLNAPLSFDSSIKQLVMLLIGHALYVIPQETRLDVDALLAYVRRNRLDVLDCVPSQLKPLLTAGLLDGSGWMPLIGLPGGEAIDEATWQVIAKAPETAFYNVYGPTECTVDSTIGRVNVIPERPNIGRPVVNTQVYILDCHLQPVPIGVPGELHIGGAGVGRGYLDHPELSAERFIPDPFGDEPGARLYKTGDLVRYLPSGNIEFLGRIDHQVKVRGFRIELGEIESVLDHHPAVQTAVVMAREEEPGEKRLVAYLVPESETDIGVGELRDYLQARLPTYMVPSAFLVLEALPLLPNGKVDRRALPAPDGTWYDLEADYRAPRTPVEELLADIWSRVLGVDRVGVHDNFFELGGHSLLVTQLISRVRDAFQVELPLRALFDLPTVAGLAEKVEAALRLSAGLSAPPIRPMPHDGELPLSFAQQRLWFLDQLEPGSPFYNIPEAVRIGGMLDVAVLERSLNEVVRRHEVLRTIFPTAAGQATQVVASELTLSLPVVDMGDLSQEKQEAETRRLVAEDAQRPFDLAHGPLLRAILLRLSEETHVILLTMHHIISDGWSIGLLIREVGALYTAFSIGEPSPLPELPLQYVDYARWQREWLQGEVLEKQLAYWKEQLGGSPPVLELPTDRPRPAVQTFRGARQVFMFSPRLTKALKALSRQEDVTLFMTLLGAFQTLLHRYTGQQNVSVGVPIAGRNRAEIEGLIGFFVNTLVMHTDLSGAPSFRELLTRVREVTLGAFAHQDLPFEALVDELQPRRDLSHTPLFQVMFILQNTLIETLELSGLTLSPLEVDSGTAKFDLTLSMMEVEEGLRGILEYNTDLFDAATINRMMDHFQTLLERIVTDPDQPIATLPLLTATERQKLLVRWNDTKAPYPHGQCAHQIFEAQVVQTPDAVAVAFKEQRLTYAELNQRANQLAYYLQKRGVGPETLVGLLMERSPDVIIGLLGVLKAGGAYLPLDPDYPPERLAFMLKDANVPIVLSHTRLRESFNQNTECPSREFLYLDKERERIAEEAETNPVSGATPDNLAYVIYTSGSTGRPKGVLLQHQGLVNLAHAYVVRFQIGPGSRVLQFFSFSFDGSVADIFMTLLSGATLCLAPQEARLPGAPLVQFLRQQQVTHGVLTPSVLAVLPQAKLAAFQTLAVGGEACLPELVVRWAPGRRFFNVYGPTETTVVSAWHQVEEHSSAPSNVPIGRPMPNTRLYILDRHLQPVPVGVPGELYIGGVGVARGYLNRPKLTAERFVPDPFVSAYLSSGPKSWRTFAREHGQDNKPFIGDLQARLYKTGDLARYLSDGNIEFLGRIDHQVKVRGFRIELGEIEAMLRQHPTLRKVCVLVREDTPGAKRLVAYVVPEQEPAPTVNELRSFIGEKLPEYMVPSVFVTLEALPLAPSGKVNRQALPAPDQARPDLEAGYVAPRTQKEETLATIWAQVLDLEQIGVHDNFFELGGDSILTIQIVSRANQAGLQLTPRQLFQHPTVAGLAAVAGVGPVTQAEQGMVEGLVPLTPIQRWFFEQDFSDPHHWNQALLLEVRQPLQVDTIKAAVEHLLAHHDALRLRFQPNSHPELVKEWKQVNVGMDDKIPFEWVDLAELPDEAQAPAMESYAAELQASLDLIAGPLMRVAYFTLGAGRSDRLLMVIHHLAIDGVSWRILMEDLQTAYEQLLRAEPVQLPLKTTSFRHWAQRLVSYAQSETVEEELGYWQETVAAKVPALPVDFVRGDNSESTVRQVQSALSGKETQSLLQDVPTAYGTEINDVLLTALIQAVAKWTGSLRLRVHLEGHGREDIFDDVDLSRTVGWFTIAYPVLLELAGTEDLGEALKTIKEQLRRVPGRGIGYGLLRYLCQAGQVRESLDVCGQEEMSFNYLGQVDQALDGALPFGLAPESPGPSHSLANRQTHLLSVSGSIVGGRLLLGWSYSENLYRRATIERLANTYMEALRALIVHCRSPEAVGYTPSDFGDIKLSPTEIEGLLEEIGEAF